MEIGRVFLMIIGGTILSAGIARIIFGGITRRDVFVITGFYAVLCFGHYLIGCGS